MLNQSAKRLIIKALQIRKENGEDPLIILEGYKNLSIQEKEDVKKEFR